jgi:hypothetical protein
MAFNFPPSPWLSESQAQQAARRAEGEPSPFSPEGLKAEKTCSICQQTYTGWGHNAAPFVGRCCDCCNERAVLLVRSVMLRMVSVRRKAA